MVVFVCECLMLQTVYCSCVVCLLFGVFVCLVFFFCFFFRVSCTSILQMVAIVYNQNMQNASTIAICSIMLSMLSVATKSFVFSVGIAIDSKSLLFTWLCAVTDFFGIFFLVSWMFYNPSNVIMVGDSMSLAGFDLFPIIGNVWIYQVMICILPFLIFSWIALISIFVIGLYNDNVSSDESYFHKGCLIFGLTVLAIILVTFFVCIALMLAQIVCFIFIALSCYFIYLERIPTQEIPTRVYLQTSKFINNCQSVDILSDLKKIDHNIDFTQYYDHINNVSNINLNLNPNGCANENIAVVIQENKQRERESNRNTKQNNYRQITNNSGLIFSKKQDRLIRICCANRVLWKSVVSCHTFRYASPTPSPFEQFLIDHSKQPMTFKNITQKQFLYVICNLYIYFEFSTV